MTDYLVLIQRGVDCPQRPYPDDDTPPRAWPRTFQTVWTFAGPFSTLAKAEDAAVAALGTQTCLTAKVVTLASLNDLAALDTLGKVYDRHLLQELAQLRHGDKKKE